VMAAGCTLSDPTDVTRANGLNQGGLPPTFSPSYYGVAPPQAVGSSVTTIYTLSCQGPAGTTPAVANLTIVVTPVAASTFTVGGTITGFPSGTSITLLDNGGDALTLTNTSNATSENFVFATPLAAGAAYSVAVHTPPAGETCSVGNGSGTIGSANVTNVNISCEAVDE
jgi:hypothetical protein